MQYTKGEDYIGTIVIEMKLLMNDERQWERRTIDDGGCRVLVIGHPDDSDDLSIVLKLDR